MKNGLDEEEVKSLAKDALLQIENKKYDFEMREEGIENILKLGIAFSGKRVSVRTE